MRGLSPAAPPAARHHRPPAPGQAQPRATEPARETRQRRRLRCAACGHTVTDPEQALSVAGGHRHEFVNPEGFTFLIGCFRSAPGCTTPGAPTFLHSWFAGYRWRYALCGRCGTHLGWEFLGSDRFFGLILPRLREE